MREHYIQILVVSIYYLNFETASPTLIHCIFISLFQYKSTYNLILFNLEKAANSSEKLHFFDLDIKNEI
jgi:hypothetical protein